jgi:formamidopyrimidine-DNA glycosylase
VPELPEVETVCRGLHVELINTPAVIGVTYSGKKLRVPIAKQNISRALNGVKFQGVRRRAKFLLLDTAEATLISHLGMSGSWRMARTTDAALKHDHCKISFEDGRSLVYHDPRRFGLLLLSKRGEEEKSRWLNTLGVEPLSTAFTAEYMYKKAQKKTAPIKNFIMDQKIVVGVGNIYAAEALFHAGIKPQRAAGKIKLSEWQSLCQHVRKVLDSAINFGGTTLRDYRKASGETGAFQFELFVYGRGGEPCRVCKTPVALKMFTGRSTYWCNQCQK